MKPLATKDNRLKIIAQLQKKYPNAHCELDYKNPFELLIATILSAQCTDIRVNMVTKVLFKKFPNAKNMAEANLAEIEEIIRSAGFYKNKAKNIKNCCQTLVEKFLGEVPQNIEDLTQLAGVGRKTANVVLGNAFAICSGIVVDTHVTRLANRFAWTKSQDAIQIEKDLCQWVPEDKWIILSHLLIWHGRKICNARKPKCEECFLFDQCPKVGL